MTHARCHLRPVGMRADCGGLLSFSTDAIGRVIAHCPLCERQARGVCRACQHAVHGKALFCDACRVARALDRDRARMKDPQNVNKRRRSQRKRYRELKRDPVRLAARMERHRAWRERTPEKQKAYKRRYMLKRTPGYVECYTRNNARPERRADKRARSLAKYYELHPTRPTPACQVCQRQIEYVPPGRPQVVCDECVKPSVLKRRVRPARPINTPLAETERAA